MIIIHIKISTPPLLDPRYKRNICLCLNAAARFRSGAEDTQPHDLVTYAILFILKKYRHEHQIGNANI